MKYLQQIKSHVLLLVLIVLTIVVCYKTYLPGTYLTGWDTLHPEFNLKMYWERIINSVWQEHQGLGAVGSQAHASEIPRIILLQTLSFFLQTSQIRYAYAFMMLILGPVGIYFFLKYLTSGFSPKASELGSFLGAVLYLLNLGTLQHFYVPLEMFLTHYGFLGFIFLYISKYSFAQKGRDLLSFLIFSVFIIPQSHTPTLFYAYFLVLFLYLLILNFLLVKKRQNTFKQSLSRFGVLLGITILINLFWLLPNIYFAINHGQELQQSKIHQLFSQEAYLANKRFGSIKDVAVLRNFLFKWGEHVGNAEFGNLLEEWDFYLHDPLISSLGYVYFGFLLLGAIIGIILGDAFIIALFSVLLVSMFFLFTDNPPLGFVFAFFQNHIPLFKEVFRFPFTKFSISLMLTYGVFFGYFFAFIWSRVETIVKKLWVQRIFYYLVLVSILASLCVYMWPVFQGDIISSSMKVDIPQRYFDMFSYLQKQNEYGRVADFPVHSFWGWVYHNWDPETELGYQGAGFLWFGVRQPLMNREFDRWNLLNEQYYKEMAYAVYSENSVLLINVLEKYKIRWLLLDESIIAPGTDQTQLFCSQIEGLFASIPSIRLEKDFGSGLFLYKYTPNKDFTLTEELNDYYKVGNPMLKEQVDTIFPLVGNHIESDKVTFPFVGLTDVDESIKKDYISSSDLAVTVNGRAVGGDDMLETMGSGMPLAIQAEVINNKLKLLFSSSYTAVPYEKAVEVSLPGTPTDTFVVSIDSSLYQISRKNFSAPKFLGVLFPEGSGEVKISVYSVAKETVNEVAYYSILESCGLSGENSSYEISQIVNGFVLTADNIMACVTANMKELLGVESPLLVDGVIFVSFKTDAAIRPNICIFNRTSGLCGNVVLGDGGDYARVSGPINEYYLRFYSGRNEGGRTSTKYENIKIQYLSKGYEVTEKLQLPEKFVLKQQDLVFNKIPSLFGTPKTLLGNPKLCASDVSESKDSKARLEGDTMIYESTGGAMCDSYWFPNVDHNVGNIVEIGSKNVSGTPLRICLTNEYSKRCDIYVELPKNGDGESYYFIPPMGKGNGYTVNLSNLSFGGEKSINELRSISIIPMQLDFIRSLHINLEPLHVKDRKLLVYNQAYEKGWVAVCGLKLCSAEHVKVNNWANGWVFDSNSNTSNVKIIFWPQILEYAGFVLFTVSLIWVFSKRNSNSIV